MHVSYTQKLFRAKALHFYHKKGKYFFMVKNCDLGG